MRDVRETTARAIAAAAAAAAMAAVLAGCGSKVASAGGPPPVLHLVAGAVQAGTADAAIAPAAQGAAGGGTGAGGSYVLQARLPASPDTAAVYRPEMTGRTAVQKLATAFGIDAAVTPVQGGYRADALSVATDGQWLYGGDCPPSAVATCPIAFDSGTGTVAAATAVIAPPPRAGGGAGSGAGASAGATAAPDSTRPTVVVPPTPAAPPSPPPTASDATALQAAAPVLSALGLSAPYASHGTVIADPVVDGLRVVGATTSISVDAGGKIGYASGRLLSATAGATYPLISAKDAFDRLPPRPVPAIGCAVLPGTPVPCPTFPPPVVSSVALGLTLTADQTGPLLVPAWLFTVRSDTWPTAVIAVQPKYIGAPPTPAAGTIEPATAIPPVPAESVPGSAAGSMPKDYVGTAPASAPGSGWFSYGQDFASAEPATASGGGSSSP